MSDSERYVVATLPITSVVQNRKTKVKTETPQGYVAIAVKLDSKGLPTGLCKIDDSVEGGPELFSTAKWSSCLRRAQALFPFAETDRDTVIKELENQEQREIAEIKARKAQRLEALMASEE